MCRKGFVAIAALVVGLSSLAVFAVTKTVDLDAQTANGAESKCDLNVLSTFPVHITNVVTNKAVGDAFEFTWMSAGPGGFRSSVTPGTAGGVGAIWEWTTNQTVEAYTGTTCDKDICFLKTAGPDAFSGTCSTGCANDGVLMSMARGTGGAVNLSWTGGTASYSVFRSSAAAGLTAPANLVTTTSNLLASDTPPAGNVYFYQVRGSSCITPKACTSNAQCNPASEGICVSRGPFSVPGRRLSGDTDVTVSASSLTYSLITFFSPLREVFSTKVIVQPGGRIDEVTNNSTQPTTYTSEAYPPGCCPSGTGDHPVRCDGTCVDVLNDPSNCGACGNVCGNGSCCSGGECVSLCSEGRIWCNGECVDPINDSDNCGACDERCGVGTCCTKAYCGSMCELGRTFCDGVCLDTQNDPANCGECGNACGDGTVCDDGECVACGEGETSCNNLCVSLGSDPYNCGACGNDCNASCPTGQKGVCGAEQVCSCAPGTPLPRPIPPIVQQPTPASCPTFDDHPAPIAGHCPSSGPSGPIDGEAPVCTVDPTSITIAAGETTTICRPGGMVFKEVPSQISVCGDGIPGQDGVCAGGVSKVTTATFMQLVPVTDVNIGNAYLTPYAVHVTNETGIIDLVSGSPVGDGLFEPGETAKTTVDLVNVGPLPIQGAIGTITAPMVDLTDDGVNNPIGLTIVTGTANYGTIPGTQPTTDCSPVTIQPKGGSTPFQITVPSTYPGDTIQPLVLNVTGTVGGSPFTMSVPLSMGIADRCVISSGGRDFDGLDGFQTPMGGMAPAEDPVPFPNRTFNPGSMLPFKMRQLCGGVELKGTDVDPPQIVGLSEATRGPIALSLIINADSSSSDALFRWNDTTKRWIFNMDTSQLGTGVFTLRIKIAGRKDYVTGFELQ